MFEVVSQGSSDCSSYVVSEFDAVHSVVTLAELWTSYKNADVCFLKAGITHTHTYMYIHLHLCICIIKIRTYRYKQVYIHAYIYICMRSNTMVYPRTSFQL